MKHDVFCGQSGDFNSEDTNSCPDIFDFMFSAGFQPCTLLVSSFELAKYWLQLDQTTD